MRYGQKRKHTGSKMNEYVKKVFQEYGHGEPSENDEDGLNTGQTHEKGRKQRRRDKKLLKKQNKLKHFQQISRKHSSKEELKPTLTKPEKPVMKSEPTVGKIDKGKKKHKNALEKDNAKEDKIITTLEKKLFLNKRKGKKKLPKSFIDAGLDYILDVVDHRGNIEEDREDKLDDEFFSEEKTDKNDVEMIADDLDDSASLKDGEVLGKDSDEDWKKVVVSGDVSSDNEGDDTFFKTDVSESCINSEETARAEKVKSDESIITTDTSAKNSEKYIPLALRVELSNKQEEAIRKMKRRAKGLFNRLSNANLNHICNDVEIMYHQNSRAIMHKVLSDVILDQFADPDPVPESLVMETAMLLAIVSARVAIDVLVHFYEAASVKLHDLLAAGTLSYANGKAVNNLIQLLGCLYQLKSIDCKVVMDFFHILVDSFTEKDIELILEILYKVGFQLRKDDPESLRNIIRKVSSKCEGSQAILGNGSRLSYMLGILTAVKNNNVRKVTGFDVEFVNNQRKKLASLIKSSSKETVSSDMVPPVTLQDFLNAETSGRWWIVGSSFAGRPMLRDEKTKDETEDIMETYEKSVSSKVVEAARKQRMNTDVRRKIFYSVMTADDFVDAFQKVIKCGLKGKQLREIAIVIVDCCQQEKTFNPYYLHLLNKFCQYDRQFGISLQCTFWDRFKILGSLKPRQRSNIAKLISHLIVMEAVPLSCLKAIEFAEVDKTMVQFLRMLLCSVAGSSADFGHLRAIFDRLNSSTKFKFVRQGLNLFLKHFILSDPAFMAEHSSLSQHFEIMSSSVARTGRTFL